ncbi:MAG: hypothetical protein K1X67_24590 [Fimbriimonadaceae bacterium]|nr:hypothetical protein [Fimbriimonadaceae bacterium]
MHDPSKMTKYSGRMIMRDETAMAEIEVRAESLDKYHFFLRVPTEDITPFVKAGQIGNIPQAWKFPSEGGPKYVIGASSDDQYFYFYVETEDQTRTRITKF